MARGVAYLLRVGQRTPTETLFGIVAAFVEKRDWTQAELARKLETTPETIRRRLLELKAGGLELSRSEEPPHVYWSVPRNWFPGVLPFKADEARDLLRLLGRARASDLRDRLLEVVVSRLSNLGRLAEVGGAGVGADGVDASDDAALERGERETERWLAVAEDALAKKTVMKMRYFTASRRQESWRHVSVHRIGVEARPQLIATCHKANTLRRFRLSNVLEARLDPGEKLRSATAKEIRLFEQETFGGFRHPGPVFRCVFVVHDPDSAWVARNLPDDRIEHETVTGGMRFSIETSAVEHLARFVTGLGGAAKAETPELAEAVATLARGALANATE